MCICDYLVTESVITITGQLLTLFCQCLTFLPWLEKLNARFLCVRSQIKNSMNVSVDNSESSVKPKKTFWCCL